MNLRKLVNDYVECERFEIQIIDGKVKIFYYDSIEGFSNNKIVIKKNDNRYIVKGKKMVIETMFEEYLIISGDIYQIELEQKDE